MNDISVSKLRNSEEALSKVSALLAELPNGPRKAGAYLLEHPTQIALASLRDLATNAGTTPNSFVRLAKALGLSGFEAFRTPFKSEALQPSLDFPDRARWLQSLEKGGQLGALYKDMAEAAIRNIEESFSGIDEAALRKAARAIWKARKVYVLGVGVNSANAQNFTYLASTGMNDFVQVPKTGSTIIDDLARADHQDILIAMTFSPYRSVIIEGVEVARAQGVPVVALTDKRTSPIAVLADHLFLTSVETPQFFPSSVSVIAILETLLSFVIAVSSPEIVMRVDKFHERRHALGIYKRGPDE